MNRFAYVIGWCSIGLLVALGTTATPSQAADSSTKKVASEDSPSGKSAPNKSDKKKAETPKTDAKHAEPAKGDAKKPDSAKGDKEKSTSGDKSGESEKPTTYKVKKRLMKIDYLLDGAFEATQTTEVALHTHEWADFEVLSAVEYGARVRQGDMLVVLDTEKIDKIISDLRHEQTVSRIAMQDAETQLQALAATMPLDLAANARRAKHAVEDLDYFLKIARPVQERIANFLVKIAENRLAYQKEELRQLEKMYKADDLVEETEEIVLKRTRDALELAKFNVELQKLDTDQTLKTMLPRIEVAMKATTEKDSIEARKTEILLPLAKRRAELAVEKLKVDAGRNEEKLQRLLADRTQMTIKAPVSGIVYYGRCTHGKWASPEMLADKLHRGGKLANDEVFITLVETRPLVVRTSVSERQLPHVSAGMQASVEATGYPDVRLTGIIQRVSKVPSGSHEFETLVSVAMDDSAPTVMPGMTCEVRLPAFRKTDAITIPTAALGVNDDDGRKYYVCFPSKGDKAGGKAKEPQKRDITIGRRSSKQIEVLKGLAEGDEILAECPKDKD